MSNLPRIAQSWIACLIAFACVAPAMAQDAPASEDELARDLTVAQKPVFEIAQLQGPQRIGIDAWVDSPSLTYRIGEPLRLSVRPRQDAYITVVDVGGSGRVAVLYPNHFQQSGRIRAGTTLTIPSGTAPWQITVGGPTGVDLIQVIASRRPLTLAELGQLARTTAAAPMITLGRSADDVARDLVPQLKPTTPNRVPAPGFGVRNLLVRIAAPGETKAGAVVPLPSANPQAAIAAPASPFGLEIRPARSVYTVGEKVHIIVSSRKSCRLTLFDVGTSGEVTRLFPNAFQRDTLIEANQPLVIPAAQASFQLVARGPSGVEGLVAICRPAAASQPPDSASPSTGFVALGPIRSVGRDLLVTSAQGGSDGPVEQVTTSYVVLE